MDIQSRRDGTRRSRGTMRWIQRRRGRPTEEKIEAVTEFSHGLTDGAIRLRGAARSVQRNREMPTKKKTGYGRVAKP